MRERPRRRLLPRILFAVGLACVLAIVVMATASRARKPRAQAAEGSRASPAGGAAKIAAYDAGDDLVEDGQRHEVRAFRFGLEEHELTIEDVGLSRALDALLEKKEAAFVVNGGFFDPEGRALGLAMSNGAVLSRLARAASGGVLTWDGARAALWETETFEVPEGTKFAVQCRPRLVVKGAPNVKRDDGKRSERTALCLREGGRVLDVVVARAAAEGGEAPGPSLFALAQHLAAHGCEDALNLDGGPSTGFAARAPDGGLARELPRGPVRHGIVIRKR